MKKLQLFTLIALLGAFICHNQTYTWSSWSWSFGDVEQNVTIVNGQVVSSTSTTVIKDAGEPETKEVDITGVRNIDAAGFGNLTIEQCAACPEILTMTADENILPHLKHEVSGKKLNLGFKDNVSIQTLTPVKFHAVVKDINKISSSGTGDTQSKGTIKTNTLKIDQSGTGNINLFINVNKVIVDNSGTGDTKLSGTTAKQIINSSGTGDYRADNLHSQKAFLNLSGTGNAYVNAQRKLLYQLSGIGNIYYVDSPKLSGSTSGLGKIKKA